MVGLVLIGAACSRPLARGRQREAGDRRGARTPPPAPTVDSLTQLPTRLYFEDRLAARRDQGRREERPPRAAVHRPRRLQAGQRHATATASATACCAQVGAAAEGAVARPTTSSRASAATSSCCCCTQRRRPRTRSRIVATRLHRRRSARPTAVDGREVIISCSIGIALYPGTAAPRQADRATPTRRCTRPSAPAARPTASTRRRMDADARATSSTCCATCARRSRTSELELFYQPKIDAQSGEVTGAEALLRWKHPKRGLVLPERLHPDRRALRPDRRDRQLGASRTPAGRPRLARPGPADARRDQPLGAPAAPGRPRRAHQRGARRGTSINPSLLTCEITEIGGDGGHRRRRRRRSDRLGALGVAPLDRRLRHRLLEPVVPAQAAAPAS